MTPKTWSEAELIEMIRQSIIDTKADAYHRLNRAATAQEIAECIYHELDEKGLIELTP